MQTRHRLRLGELRSDARQVLDAAAEGEVFEVGAHRKPEAVVIGVKQFEQQAPPANVMQTLLAFLAGRTASLHVETLDRMGSEAPFHPGDGFGRVVAWLWATEQPGRACLLVADLVAGLREGYPEGRIPPTLDQVVTGIGFSLPFDVPASHRTQLLEHLKREVPNYLGTTMEIS